jgi:hypothetical protein
MNGDHVHDSMRRRVLTQTVGAGIGVVLVRTIGRAAAAAPAKLAKEAVKYTDVGTVEGKDCDDCSQYLPPASPDQAPTCRIVEGPISPHGHCIAFSPKPR